MSAADVALLAPRAIGGGGRGGTLPWCCATVEFQPSFISLDTLTCDAFAADAWETPLPVSNEPPRAAAQQPMAPGPSIPAEATDAWTAEFVRALQAEHARVRDFLQAQRDRWQKAAAELTRQIETLQTEVDGLRAANENLRKELLPGPAAAAAVNGGDWETQKRRCLAGLKGGDQRDPAATERPMKNEEIVAHSEKMLAEKSRELEGVRRLLDYQTSNSGSSALAAAAREQVLDQDAIVLEERQRLQQLQDECRDKLRRGEIELAMERARLARRDAEIEEKLRNAEVCRSSTEDAPLAPTGRPARGRWRTQLGLTDDGPPEIERSRDRQ